MSISSPQRRPSHLVSDLISHLSFTLIHIFHSHSVVPADTQWIKGDKISVDTAALTGEPIPRKYPGEHGDIILSGTTVVAGECYGRVLKTGTNTEIGQAQADVLADKTVSIVSVFQKKIMTVVQVLVSASLVLVIAVLLVEGIKYNGFDTNWKQTILDAVSKVFFLLSVTMAALLPLLTFFFYPSTS